MSYLNPIHNRLNGAAWASGFATLDKQLDALFSQLPTAFDLDAGAYFASGASPRARWYESEAAYVARIDLPGLKSKDIALELENEAVTINAERKESNGSEEKGEAQRVARYSRRVAVPDGVDAEKISAAYEHGVLSLTFPKSEKAKPRRIEVKAL